MSKQFHKLDRYTLAQKIFSLLLEMTVDVIRAETAPTQRKLAPLESVSNNLDIVKVLVRMCNSLTILEERTYISLESELQEIGKMLGGWIRSLTANAPAKKADAPQ